MLESLSVPMVRSYIKNILGEGWQELEPETIVMTLFPQGISVSPLLLDKISVARIFTLQPELFFNDLMFFMHACDVFNDVHADFDAVPELNSLEVAKAIIEAARMLDVMHVNELPAFTEAIREYVKHVLINDGYTGVVFPFDVVGVTGLGSDGINEMDLKQKRVAINKYIHGDAT